MKKIVIGILQSKNISDKLPYENYYKIVKYYADRITENNAIPIGLIDVNNNLEVLELCDGFIMPGGKIVTVDNYQIINHCIEKNKPLLGICLGMQSMVIHDYVKGISKKEIDANKIYEEYKKLCESNERILKKLENEDLHGGKLVNDEIESTINNILDSTHRIEINKDSILYKIYKKDNMDVVSMHKYGVYDTKKEFKIIAKSNDDVVEAVQYDKDNYWILGIQFHIEYEKNNKIIKQLIEESKKRKNKINIEELEII